MSFDPERFGAAVARQISAAVDRSLAPVTARIDGLERFVQLCERRLEDRIDRTLKERANRLTAEIRQSSQERVEPEGAGSDAANELSEDVATFREALDELRQAMPTAIDEAALAQRISEPLTDELDRLWKEIERQSGQRAVRLDEPAVTRKELAELQQRIDELRGQMPKAVDEDALAARVRAGISGEVSAVREAIPEAVDLEALRRDLASATGEQIAELQQRIDELRSQMPKAVDEDALGDRVRQALAGDLSKIREDIPEPIDVEALRRDLAGATSEQIAALQERIEEVRHAQPPAIKDASLNHDHELRLVMTDGTVIKVDGRLKGDDGEPGLGVEDLQLAYKEPNVLVVSLARGDRIVEREIALPAPVLAGPYQEGRAYVPGNLVTLDGHAWACRRETTSRPRPGDDWYIFARRGRDAKSRGPRAIETKSEGEVDQK